MAACTGFGFATMTTVPFLLVTSYHDDKLVSSELCVVGLVFVNFQVEICFVAGDVQCGIRCSSPVHFVSIRSDLCILQSLSCCMCTLQLASCC